MPATNSAKRAGEIIISPTRKKAATVVTLFIQDKSELVAIRVNGRVDKVVRLEDGLYHVLPSVTAQTPVRAIDFLVEGRRAEAAGLAKQVIEQINATLRGKKPAGAKYYDEEEPEEDPVVLEMVEISANLNDYTDWGIPDPGERYINCIERCTATCVGQVSGTAENIFCTIATAIGAIACSPSGIGSILCGTAAGVACYSATAWVRGECPSECVSICW